MRIGTLRHKVEIQALTVTEDAIGNQVEEWTKVADVWAAVEPLQGDEKLAAAYIQADTTHRVTIRYLAGITPADRLLFDGRILEIESVRNLEERNRELVLMCKEKVGG